jgi:DNA repair ATPase RecN
MIVLCLQVYTYYASTPKTDSQILGTIDNYTNLLNDKINQLKMAEKVLKDTYDQIKKGLDDAENKLKEALNGIEGVQTTVKKYKPLLPIAKIGSLPELLENIKGLILAANPVLGDVKDILTPILPALDPNTDSKKIYKNLTTALTELTKAKDALAKFRRACELFGI